MMVCLWNRWAKQRCDHLMSNDPGNFNCLTGKLQIIVSSTVAAQFLALGTEYSIFKFSMYLMSDFIFFRLGFILHYFPHQNSTNGAMNTPADVGETYQNKMIQSIHIKVAIILQHDCISYLII